MVGNPCYTQTVSLKSRAPSCGPSEQTHAILSILVKLFNVLKNIGSKLKLQLCYIRIYTLMSLFIFISQKDLIHTIGESAALGAAGFVIWGDLNLTSSRVRF